MDGALRSRLLAWYGHARRDLPWRRTRDPYAVWVSEAMLQQTRVATATAYYERWMRRFPDVQALAEADEEDVLAAWSGLGYYARARALHRAARIVARHGRFPSTAEELRGLPGIGAYTAGAVASIAFGQAVPAVDGNVVRVLCRLDGHRGDPRTAPVRRAIEARATQLVDPDRPGDWNQALMELGALVCTPRSPRCGDCPVAKACRARQLGIQDAVPPPRRRTPPPVETPWCAVVRRGDEVLLVRNPDKGLLGGTWRLPGLLHARAADALPEAVRAETGVRVHLAAAPRTVRHAFTHRVWDMQVVEAIPQGGAAAGAAHWIALDDLDRHPVSTAMRRALA